MVKEQMQSALLTGTIVVLLLANLWVLGQQLGLPGAPRPKPFAEAVMEEIWRERLKNDPPLGAEVTELKGLRGRRLVVVVERCTDCVAQTLKDWAEAAKEAQLPSLILVTGDKIEDAQRVLDRWRIEAELVSDPKGEIAKKLNAFFTPRAYAFEDSRLVWKQEQWRTGFKKLLKGVQRK